jgi:hypothetical protein
MLGMNLVREVFPYLGPDAGLFLAAAPDQATLPQMLIALRVQPGPKEAPVDEALWNALNFYVSSLVFGHNLKSKDLLRVKTIRPGKGEIKYLEHRQFPAGFQPAYALKDGYLLLASSADAIERFQKSAVPAMARPILVRISLDQMERLLRQHEPWVLQAMLQKDQMTEKAARQWLQDVLPGLSVFDRVEIEQRTSEGQVTWSLRFLVARP